MSNRPNRQQRRAEERKQEAYATIQKLTAKAVKITPDRKNGVKLSSFLTAVTIVSVLILAVIGGSYLILSSGAQSGGSVVRHVPGK
jgi:hypothetical protein